MQSQWEKKHMRQREKHVRQRQVKQIFIQTVDKFCKQKDCKIVEKINTFFSKKSLSISPKRQKILEWEIPPTTRP